MKRKTAYLIINPRLGKKVDALTAMIAALSAAGWKTDTAIKEFGGHTRRLARKAALRMTNAESAQDHHTHGDMREGANLGQGIEHE